MPAVARGQSRDTVTTNHSPCSTTTTTNACSSNVFVNDIGVHRQGDLNTTHSIPCGDSCCSHSVELTAGSDSVIVNGKGIARVGDRYSGCGEVSTGSNNVFAN